MSPKIDQVSAILPGASLHIKSWFVEKENLSADGEAVITGETDRAYCMYFADGNDGPHWVPKSICEVM